MSTRAHIITKQAEGVFTAQYVHSDGYVEGVGRTLAKNYTDPEKIAALVALGDLSTLGSEIGEKHGFDDRSNPEWTRAYRRDRGEAKGTSTKHFTSREEAIDAALNASQYVYIWEGGAWLVTKDGRTFSSLG